MNQEQSKLKSVLHDNVLETIEWCIELCKLFRKI